LTNWLPFVTNNAGVSVVASPTTNDVLFRLPPGVWNICLFGDVDPITGALDNPLNLSADGTFFTAIQLGLKYRLSNTTGSLLTLDNIGPFTSAGFLEGNGWAIASIVSINSSWNYGARFQVPANTSYDVGVATSKSVAAGGTVGDLTLNAGHTVYISFSQAFGSGTEDKYVASTSLSRGTIGTQVASIAEQLSRLQEEREKIEKLVAGVELKFASPRIGYRLEGKEEKKEPDDDCVMLPVGLFDSVPSKPAMVVGVVPFSPHPAAALAPSKKLPDKGVPLKK